MYLIAARLCTTITHNGQKWSTEGQSIITRVEFPLCLVSPCVEISYHFYIRGQFNHIHTNTFLVDHTQKRVHKTLLYWTSVELKCTLFIATLATHSFSPLACRFTIIQSFLEGPALKLEKALLGCEAYLRLHPPCSNKIAWSGLQLGNHLN